MRRSAFLLCWCSWLAWAGGYDYFECVAPGGAVTYSVERCPKGHAQRRIEDDTPPASANLGAAAGGIVRLESARGGHFYATVSINGVPVRAVIDTGATTVALSPAAARRVGLDTRRGVRVTTHTANGAAPALGVMLQSVELGGNAVRNVAGLVLSQEMGPDTEALLGMSFLKHFEVSTDGVAMTLRPK